MTEGLDSSEPWASVSFASAPAEMAHWSDKPERWSEGWVVSAYDFERTTDQEYMWLSKDGRSWSAWPVPAQPLPGPGGLIAFDGNTAWKSSDGAYWREYQMTGSYPTSPGTIVGDSAGMLTSDLYYSADGIAWEEVELPKPAGERLGRAVAWNGSRFIVVETLRLPDGPVKSYSFTSTDGRTWTSSEIESASESVQVVTLEATSGGVVAGFATVGGSDPKIWLQSADGLSFQGATELEALGRVSLDSNGTRFLATVWLERGGWNLWTSLDGRTWTAMMGKIANAAILMPELMPHGIFLAGAGACWESPDGGGCTSFPPDFPYYGPAK